MATVKKGDLYVASVIHVLRDGDQKDDRGRAIKETRAIQPGQMASETDLTAKEIESIQKRAGSRGSLRPPTFEEMQAMDAREEQKASADAAREAEQEAANLAADQKLEKDRLEAEQRAEADEERRKLEEKQAKEREAAAPKAPKAAAKK